MSRAQLLALTAVASLLLAAVGYAWEVARFGWQPAGHQAHLQQEITRRVAGRAREVETKATVIARHADLVAVAATSPNQLPELFARVSDRLAAGLDSVSATVWVPSSPGLDYRALAWTDGLVQDVAAIDLSRAPGLFVAAGTGGLRLIFAKPIEIGESRIGVVTAEAQLSAPTSGSSFRPRYVIASSAGPIVIEPMEGRLPSSAADHFVIASPSGAPLLDAFVPAGQITQSRHIFRRRALAVVLVPWAGWLLVWFAAAVDARRASGASTAWAGWTAVLALGVAAAAWVTMWVVDAMAVPAVWRDVVLALASIAVAALLFGAAWQRTPAFAGARERPARFLVEQLLGGIAMAMGFAATALLWHNRIGPSIEQWHLPILSSTASVAVGLAALLVAQISVSWAAASALGILAARWGVSWRQPASWLAVVLWAVPSAIGLAVTSADDRWPAAGGLALLAGAAAFGLSANAIRTYYRRTSQAQRLVLQFCALAAPILVAYPLASSSADRATREIIEGEYGPATQEAKQPDRLMETLTTAWADIDAIAELPELLREAGSSLNSSQQAFRVWNRTALSTKRVTSQIELYGSNRALVSRFALNVPGFGALSQASNGEWSGAGCAWDAFPEMARFGAGERLMMHAERAVCGGGGEFLGAVVIRIVPDYRTLPFVTSTNPYYDALGSPDLGGAGSRIPELQVVIYGWSLQPVFVSGRIMWPLDEQATTRLTRSRDAFWTERVVEGRTYRVYFLNDRGGIYALGYPAPTPLQHATRLAESAAVLVLLFLAYQAATVLLGPWTGRGQSPLARLFTEVRASFYRKLFLFFVVAAVGPVVLFAVAFGTYMTAKLRADVESEAGTVVLMARRVLDELSAAQAPAGQSPPAPTDEIMVWIRQVVDQDVNLFEGSELLATSQRDLFNLGLLPTRTPASVYRQVALDRRPVFVAEDRLGTFRYLVAAAPVPALGRQAVLTVPLASRQREFERQIDELTQGVLTGAVVLVLFAAALGASVAARVSDPVARLTRATRLVAAGRFDERLAADTADELGRLVEDFNTMTEMLVAQRAELAHANQVKAWAEMAGQVAHEIKNPLTPIQLAAEHLQRVHDDAGRPLGPVVEHCLRTILSQVRLLRQIASEFSTFAGAPTPRFESVDLAALIAQLTEPYRMSSPVGIRVAVSSPAGLPHAWIDRTLVSRAITNLVENAVQAMPSGGSLDVTAAMRDGAIEIVVADTGVGMDDESAQRAFEPYFSTRTVGSGLGLANARRNVELCGGTVTLESRLGQGTTVTVKLPAEPPAPPGAPAPAR